MSLTPSDHHWHRVYRSVSPELNDIINDSYAQINRFIREEPAIDNRRLTTVGDDRAEALVAAITRFVVECNPNHPAVIAALEAAAKED